MKTKRQQIKEELLMIELIIDMVKNEGLTFDEFIETVNINKPVLKCRLDELGYNWKDLKNEINENHIQKYFEVLDKNINITSNTYLEDLYEMFGENDVIKRYCHERGILSKDYRYTIKDTDGSIKHVRKSNHPLYMVWLTKKTVTGHNSTGYISEHHKKYYLDKGVDMWMPWVESFDKFYDDMLELGWYQGCHISRIGDEGNYEPNNVEILSARENIQAAHPGTSVKIVDTKNGKQYYFESLNMASKVLGLNPGSLSLKLKGTKVYEDYDIELLQ